jgi:hypothetical protein
MSCDDESYGNMRYENSVTATLVLAREIPVSRSLVMSRGIVDRCLRTS